MNDRIIPVSESRRREKRPGPSKLIHFFHSPCTCNTTMNTRPWMRAHSWSPFFFFFKNTRVPIEVRRFPKVLSILLLVSVPVAELQSVSYEFCMKTKSSKLPFSVSVTLKWLYANHNCLDYTRESIWWEKFVFFSPSLSLFNRTPANLETIFLNYTIKMESFYFLFQVCTQYSHHFYLSLHFLSSLY